MIEGDSQIFAYHNDSDHELLVIVEPWTEEYRIPPRSNVDVVVRGARLDRTLEVAQGAEKTTIFGYPGSVVSIVRDGREVEPFTGKLLDRPRDRVPGPDLPEGMRPSDFLGLLGLRTEN